MAKNSKIGWTTHTFNIAWGCTKISPGCKNCYAESLSTRFGKDVWGPNGIRKRMSQKYWNEPLRWNKEAAELSERPRVFCSSMCDILEPNIIIEEELTKLWPLIRQTPELDWLLLTKRPERYRECLPSDWGKGWPNVWIGTSIENNDYVSRADSIRDIPAVIRFVSYEPALGPLTDLDLTGIDWLIYGGESGDGFRQDNDEWARVIRLICDEKGVSFFYKQSSGRYPEGNIKLDGQVVRKFPLPQTRRAS